MKIERWVSVNAAEADLKRAEAHLTGLGCHVSSVSSVKEIDLSTLSRTVIRLYGRARSEVLTWLGSEARVPAEVAILGLADAVFIDDQGDPPKAAAFFNQAVIAALADHRAMIERSGSGLVVGATDDARSFVSALAQIGLNRILIVDIDDAETERLAASMRRRILSIAIEPLSCDLLTQLASEASFAVNLVAPTGQEERDLIEDVSYLNFLLPGGMWIDWTGATRDIGLADEILTAGATVFDAELIKDRLETTCIAIAQAYGRAPR